MSWLRTYGRVTKLVVKLKMVGKKLELLEKRLTKAVRLAKNCKWLSEPDLQNAVARREEDRQTLEQLQEEDMRLLEELKRLNEGNEKKIPLAWLMEYRLRGDLVPTIYDLLQAEEREIERLRSLI